MKALSVPDRAFVINDGARLKNSCLLSLLVATIFHFPIRLGLRTKMAFN